MVAQRLAAGRGAYVLAMCLALIPAAVKLLCYPNNIGSDDAYIHLQIATNFVHGLGWGINPHQPVNLSTSPAFTLILATAEIITHHAVLLAQVLSATAVVIGLLLIFFVVYSETQSSSAALFAEFAAAFSVNLWRWNGSLMEATFGFAAIATILYLFRKSAPDKALRRFIGGGVLGFGVLLRPEIGIVVVLVLSVQWLRSSAVTRVLDSAIVLAGVALPVIPWCIFAKRNLGSVLPTTLAAKSTAHFILYNPAILRQFAESVIESILFPTLLILVLAFITRRKTFDLIPRTDWLVYVVPAGWVALLVAFYYLKTPLLQSPGRYLLPLLPAEAMLLGAFWANMEAHLTRWQTRTAATFIALQVVFASTLNYKIVMPPLQRFEANYGATMRAVSEQLAERTSAQVNRRILVEDDIGVLSYAANGRFEIYDGGALATPSFRNQSLRQQIAQSQPAYVVESLSPDAGGFEPEFSDLFHQVWERRFDQYGVRISQAYYYVIIFKMK